MHCRNPIPFSYFLTISLGVVLILILSLGYLHAYYFSRSPSLSCWTFPEANLHTRKNNDPWQEIFQVMLRTASLCPGELDDAYILETPTYIWSHPINPYSDGQSQNIDSMTFCYYEAQANVFLSADRSWGRGWENIKWPNIQFPRINFLPVDQFITPQENHIFRSHTLGSKIPSQVLIHAKDLIFFTFPIFSPDGQEMWFSCQIIYPPPFSSERRYWQKSDRYLHLKFENGDWRILKREFENSCGMKFELS